MRIEGSETCTSTLKKSYLSWCIGNFGSCDIYMRWCSQDDQRLNGGYKGRSPEQSLLLEGSTITCQVETSISSDDVFTQVWQIRLRHRESLYKFQQRRDH